MSKPLFLKQADPARERWRTAVSKPLRQLTNKPAPRTTTPDPDTTRGGIRRRRPAPRDQASWRHPQAGVLENGQRQAQVCMALD